MAEGFSLVALDDYRRATDAGKVPPGKLKEIEALAMECPGVQKATAKSITRYFPDHTPVEPYNVRIDIEVATEAALKGAFVCIDEKLHKNKMGTHSDGYG